MPECIIEPDEEWESKIGPNKTVEGTFFFQDDGAGGIKGQFVAESGTTEPEEVRVVCTPEFVIIFRPARSPQYIYFGLPFTEDDDKKAIGKRHRGGGQLSSEGPNPFVVADDWIAEKTT
jgi:hypothetical protein